jgi:hypothetical protein
VALLLLPTPGDHARRSAVDLRVQEAALIPEWLADVARRMFPKKDAPPPTVTVDGYTMPVERCYPMRALADGRVPRITSRHAIHNPSRPRHRGVDLFYPYVASDPPMRIGDGGRTAKWWVPDRTWAVAVADGVVEKAGSSATGFRVWLRHPGGMASGYFHLSELATTEGATVRMGDPLGVIGDNPSDHDARHLHFEVFLGDLRTYPKGTVDPEAWLKGARVLR